MRRIGTGIHHGIDAAFEERRKLGTQLLKKTFLSFSARPEMAAFFF
jgi:hypothetical protein